MVCLRPSGRGRRVGGSAPLRTRSLLRPRVGAVLALVDPALGGHVGSVHDFRVAARSLRAALRTLTRRPDSSLVLRTGEALRSSIRALADVRDRDVGHLLLTRLRDETKADLALQRRVAGLCERDRRVARTLSFALWPRKLDRLLIDLLRQEEPSLRVIIRRARAEAWRQRRRALDLIRRLGRRFNPEDLHQVRRRVRGLRYALEILAEVDSVAHTRVALLKPVQSALGDGQDRIVLSTWLKGQATRLRRTDAALTSELRREAAHFRRQSRESHAAFLKLRPREVLESLSLHVDPFKTAPQTSDRVQVRVEAAGRMTPSAQR